LKEGSNLKNKSLPTPARHVGRKVEMHAPSSHHSLELFTLKIRIEEGTDAACIAAGVAVVARDRREARVLAEGALLTRGRVS
jgi:hypothetical protein